MASLADIPIIGGLFEQGSTSVQSAPAWDASQQSFSPELLAYIRQKLAQEQASGSNDYGNLEKTLYGMIGQNWVPNASQAGGVTGITGGTTGGITGGTTNPYANMTYAELNEIAQSSGPGVLQDPVFRAAYDAATAARGTLPTSGMGTPTLMPETISSGTTNPYANMTIQQRVEAMVANPALKNDPAFINSMPTDMGPIDQNAMNQAVIDANAGAFDAQIPNTIQGQAALDAEKARLKAEADAKKAAASAAGSWQNDPTYQEYSRPALDVYNQATKDAYIRDSIQSPLQDMLNRKQQQLQSRAMFGSQRDAWTNANIENYGKELSNRTADTNNQWMNSLFTQGKTNADMNMADEQYRTQKKLGVTSQLGSLMNQKNAQSGANLGLAYLGLKPTENVASQSQGGPLSFFNL
jgi:hypothetical protein